MKRYIPASLFIRVCLLILLLGTVVMFILAGIFSPPKNFPANALITIPAGSSAYQFSATLKSEHVIRSQTAFRILARVTTLDRHLDPGAYVFKKPLNLTGIVSRIGNAEHGVEPVRITLTEGMTSFDMASTFSHELPGFDATSFLQQSSTSEGYLFPETYFFMPGDSSADIVVRLKSQFSQEIASITPEVLAFNHPFSDDVIMASILEREAQSPEDKRMVAGILWNRIAKGMPLQVDAAFGYAHQENGYTPTANDLTGDSPYNTYRNRGLPPTPISNPGIDALLAAVTPIKSNYVYYLTGKDGKMHYAVTFEQHKKNRALYLN